MEEMNRTHKEPVWGWVAVVAAMISKSSFARVRAEARTAPRSVNPRRHKVASVVTPWSPRSPAGWSA